MGQSRPVDLKMKRRRGKGMVAANIARCFVALCNIQNRVEQKSLSFPASAGAGPPAPESDVKAVKRRCGSQIETCVSSEDEMMIDRRRQERMLWAERQGYVWLGGCL
ncbi:uncharacterized protein UV8b_02796 [Ustilaginoidea virens]|uniref:Uncharacterized protein n=1 Tax=Ustilaginoidea virens TaxID=1159556 RepID=A0A8E5HNL5_USTVR|nr:uncharacterized protein UV8b_02796 [Ustilaginoidea virens]QUC18555.1 hypothetical protein UV8b_02796 [Ustilaginoidea virens]